MKVTNSPSPAVQQETSTKKPENKALKAFGNSTDIIKRENPGKLSRWQVMERVDLLRKNGGEIKFASEKLSVPTEPLSGVDPMLKSDVGLNDPTDPATTGKLKDLLSRGGVNFSDKERDVLEKILK